MISIQPWTLADASDRRLVALAKKVVGQRLSSVKYIIPVGETWPHGHSHDNVHEIDMGIELTTERDVLTLQWAMEGFNEGLAIALDSGYQASSDELVDRIDVSANEAWRKLVGFAVAGIAVSFHRPAEGSPSMPWSFRIELTNGANVVIALGEVAEAGLSFMPDNILAIFDQMTARSYQIASSSQTSWGEIVGV